MIVTGGEPLLRSELFAIAADHPGMLFLTFSNGTLIDAECARRIKACGNLLPLISLEGDRSQTPGF